MELVHFQPLFFFMAQMNPHGVKDIPIG